MPEAHNPDNNQEPTNEEPVQEEKEELEEHYEDRVAAAIFAAMNSEGTEEEQC